MAKTPIIQSLSLSLSAAMTHWRHDVLVECECDVGTAVVLVSGAGMAFGRWRQRDVGPALSQARAGLDEAVVLLNGHALLAHRAAPTTFSADPTGPGATPHLHNRQETRQGTVNNYLPQCTYLNTFEYQTKTKDAFSEENASVIAS